MSIQKEKWYVQSKKADFKAVGEKYGIDQVTARIIRNRDIIEDADIAKYLHPDLSDLYSPHLMKDMDRLIEILHKKKNPSVLLVIMILMGSNHLIFC